jgi:glycosyltransferase involved in cell wall biosynthesis
MVVLEALAIGLPVLAPAIGELPYLAVDEPLLHLYDPAAPIKALAQWSAGSLHGRGQPHHTGASHWLRDWSAVAAEASQWLLQQA